MKLWVGEKSAAYRTTDAYDAKYGMKAANYASVMREEGEQRITVDFETPVEQAVVRPLRLGIIPEIDGTRVSFSVNDVCDLSVEINGSAEGGLILFVEDRETVPKHGAHFLYFGPGETDADEIEIREDDTTVYFAEGAFVTGKIHAENVTGLTICGNGILSMDAYDRFTAEEMLLAVKLNYCKNVRIRNIKVINSCCWSVRVYGCDDVEIDHVRLIGSRGNSDGVDVCGSRNVTVRNLFTRLMDDSLVVKAFDTGDTEHVLFENCTLWNDFARPIEVGVELRADHVRDITFRNIDIIHSMVGYPCMGIHHGDRAEVSDILFEDVRIEDARGAQLFDLRITDSVWNKDTKKGNIHDITFRNISLVGEPGIRCLPSFSRLSGFSEECPIENITFENISLLGKQARTPDELCLTVMDHVKNVRVKAEEHAPHITLVKTEITEETPFERQPDGIYHGSLRVTATNTADVSVSTRLWLQSDPVYMAKHDSAPWELTLEKGASAERTFDVTAYPGTYVFSVQSDDVNILPAWYFRRLDTILPRDPEGAPGYPVTDSDGNESAPIFLSVDNGMLDIRSELLKDSRLVIYTAKPVPTMPGQVLFTTPETDFGMAPALTQGKNGPEPAPQLRCPAEITYVFKNEPKVEKINRVTTEIKRGGNVRIPMKLLGLEPDTKEFWFEILILGRGRKYPCTMFHSPDPSSVAHMFNTAKIQ